MLSQSRFPEARSLNSGAPSIPRRRAGFDRRRRFMISPLLISVAFAFATAGAAWLWGLLVAIGMNRPPDGGSMEKRDLRTW